MLCAATTVPWISILATERGWNQLFRHGLSFTGGVTINSKNKRSEVFERSNMCIVYGFYS